MNSMQYQLLSVTTQLASRALDDANTRIAELEAALETERSEAEENCKIIGASAERELALRARVDRLERKSEQDDEAAMKKPAKR